MSTLENPIITGWRARVITARIWGSILRVALSRYSPIRAVQTLMLLYSDLRASWLNTDSGLTPKLVRGVGRHFVHPNYPGFPSPAFDRFMARELDRVLSPRRDRGSLQTVILSMTRRCALSCQHCSEWKTLNRPEQLFRQDLLAITERFLARGVTQILLSGGEPMLRLDDVLALCRAAGAGTEYWIATSGHRLDAEAARRLAEAGLTGVYISMDHFEPDRHDAFRGRPGSFRQVRQAARSVREADLVLCLSLCPTREFVSRQNLERYAGRATELGAGFIQILDPRAAGRWEGEDVALSPKQNALLDDFYLTLNRDPASSQLPSVIYHGYYQRRQGCLGAGKRFLFVNSAGEVHACPFCPASAGSSLDGPLDAVLEQLGRFSCHAYPGRPDCEPEY